VLLENIRRLFMYNQAIEIRDTIVHALKKDERIGNITAVTSDGFLITTIDVAIQR